MKRISLFLVLCLMVFSFNPLNGQGARWRGLGPFNLFTSRADGFVFLRSKSKITFRYQFDVTSSALPIKGDLDLGMEIQDATIVTAQLRPDGSRRYGSGAVLFCGKDGSGKGVIALVGPRSGKYQLLSRKVYPQNVFLGIGHSFQAKKLYLLDATKGVIMKGDFDPSTSTLPPSLSVLVNSTQCPGLQGDLSNKTLVELGSDQGAPGMVVGDFPHPFLGKRFWLILDKATGPFCKMHLGDSGFPVLAEPRGLLLDGQTKVKVEGLAGEAFQIRSGITGQVMGGGVLPSSGAVEVTVQALMMGDIYGVWSQRDSHFHGMFGTPIKLWGTEATLPSGFKMLPFHPQRGLVAEIEQGGGEPVDLSPTLRMSPPKPLPKQNKQWNAWLLIGTDQDVNLVGGEPVITSGVMIPQTMEWEAGSERNATVSAFFPAPADPDLAGTIATFQWMVEEGGELYFSSIIGVMLRLEPWEPDQAYGEGPSNASRSKLSGSSLGRKKRLPQKRKKMGKILRGKALRWWIKRGAKAIPENLRKAILRKE